MATTTTSNRKTHTKPARPLVVLVHGLLMNRMVMQPLAKRLRAQGHDVVCFGYNSVWGGLADNANRLCRFVSQSGPSERPVVFVGHSMGGVVSWMAASQLPADKVAALVLLGSPVNGSKAARILREWTGRQASRTAKTLHDWADLPSQPTLSVPVFTLAGTRTVGIGQVLCRFSEPNDGTVSVRETQVDTARASAALPVSHLGMLFDASVAALVTRWIRSLVPSAA